MSIYTRKMARFAPDWRWIAHLVVLIGISVTVGLLEAWPFAVLVDAVLTQEPKGDWIHGLFLAAGSSVPPRALGVSSLRGGSASGIPGPGYPGDNHGPAGFD
jgi:hypothetical protein